MDYAIGIDIGSTTVKVVVLDDQDHTIFHTYERHMSKVREKTAEMLRELSVIYNSVRQAAITQQIVEVAGGAKAQKRKKTS